MHNYSGDGKLSEAAPGDDSDVNDDWSDATGLDGDDDFGDDSSGI